MGRATHEAVYEARHALDLVADDPVDGGPDVPPRGVGPTAPTSTAVTRAIAVSSVSSDCVYHEEGPDCPDHQAADSHAF